MCTYNLNYNDYNTNLCEGLQSILASSEMSDVTLAVEGKYFKAHQLILSMFSTYFRELFNATPSKQAIFFMKNVHHRIMKHLLTFMYEGKVEIPSEDFQLFVETAGELKIKGLTNDTDLKTNKEYEEEVTEVPMKQHSTPTRSTENKDYTVTAVREVEPEVSEARNCKQNRLPVQISSEVSILPVTSELNEHHHRQEDQEVFDKDLRRLKEESIMDICEVGTSEVTNSYSDFDIVESDNCEDNNMLKKVRFDAEEFFIPDSRQSHLMEGEAVTVRFCQPPNSDLVNGIIWDDFRYCKQRNLKTAEYGEISRWRCTGQSNLKCKAKVLISRNGHICLMETHSHHKVRVHLKPETTVQTRILTALSREDFTRKYRTKYSYTQFLN